MASFCSDIKDRQPGESEIGVMSDIMLLYDNVLRVWAFVSKLRHILCSCM